ncbi:hypothetical protein [Streptomonospora alba]|nr:hypothetical protein [Streptomonospora alba]
METESGHRRPRPRNARAKVLLWTAVATIAAYDSLLDRIVL